MSCDLKVIAFLVTKRHETEPSGHEKARFAMLNRETNVYCRSEQLSLRSGPARHPETVFILIFCAAPHDKLPVLLEREESHPADVGKSGNVIIAAVAPSGDIRVVIIGRPAPVFGELHPIIRSGRIFLGAPAVVVVV